MIKGFDHGYRSTPGRFATLLEAPENVPAREQRGFRRELKRRLGRMKIGVPPELTYIEMARLYVTVIKLRGPVQRPRQVWSESNRRWEKVMQFSSVMGMTP